MTAGIAPLRMRTSREPDFDCEEPRIPQSDAAETLYAAAREAKAHFFYPLLAQEHAVGRKFEGLAESWRTDNAYTSSVHEMAMHPAYQKIIGMGQDAIPFLLKELRRRPDHWFWALNAITGIDPVPESDRGDLSKMACAWVNWGIRNGKL